MPHHIPACPMCGLENTYPDAGNYVCPDCAYEWPQVASADSDAAASDAGDAMMASCATPTATCCKTATR